jgi:hypothetical protein
MIKIDKMPSMRCLLLTAALVGCGAPSRPAGGVSNTTSGDAEAKEIAVDATAALGVLALPAAAERPDKGPFWVAKTPDAAAVVPSPAPLVAGTHYRALSAAGGAPVDLTAGPQTTIGFGCDQTSLDVVPLVGDAVKPGLVWVLPSPAPATWTPSAVPLTVDVDQRDHRLVRAGNVSLELRRVDKTHATLRIADRRATGLALDEAAEAYYMEGAEPIDLDLTQGHYPGIPWPEAVFAFSETGPYLVVLDRSGYEGIAFETLLVTSRGRAQVIESLGLGAYYCAF